MHSDESDHRLGRRGQRAGKAAGRNDRSGGTFTRRSGMALASAGLLLLGGLPAAAADPEDAPSQQDVESAKERVRDAERQVSDIRADLAAANQELEKRSLAAAQAAEEYNGARWRLQQARETAKAAERKAAQARQRVARQGEQIGSLVADTYQGGGRLSQLGAYLLSTDTDALGKRYAAFAGASDSMRSRFDRFTASDSLAQVFEEEAAKAVREANAAETEAKDAKEAAEQALAAQQAAVDDIAQRRDALIAELARARNISVELAEQRQAALEERQERRRRQEARAQAQRERRAAQAQEADGDASGSAGSGGSSEESSQQSDGSSGQDGGTQQSSGSGSGDGSSSGGSTSGGGSGGGSGGSSGGSTRPSQPSSGVDTVLGFARAQVGEPYVWGSAGPDTWDCSGLTMRAWQQAGEYLPHWSVAQYYETSRVSYSQLRPGDLVFWASESGNPDSIFHVALYIGNDQMIHAPRSGVPVSVENVFYWRTPDFYGRL